MSKFKNKNCYARINKNGDIVSYRFFYTGKDILTNKTKQFTKTWKIPKNLSPKEIELERKKQEIIFIKTCEDKNKGVYIDDSNITFGEFADTWLNEIKLKDNAFGSYISAKNHLKILKEHLGNYTLRSLTPVIIQNFYNYLSTRTYIKEKVYIKQSLYDLFSNKEIPLCKLAKNIGINRLTLRMLTKVGEKVSMVTAQNVSSFFNVPLDKYFSVTIQAVKYSYATNRDIKTALVMILNSAKKRMLIDHNYATKEYTNPTTGITKEKTIYNEEQSKEFLKYILCEPDIRKKTLFSLYLFLGLRNAEICGLEWKDIDLSNNVLRIERNSLYFREFGVITKEPKTHNSKRSLTIPITLANILKEYKKWWDIQKEGHGDLWFNCDRLFLQDNGKPIHPCTPANWLKKFEDKHGLIHVPPHSLRHTSITLQLLAGVPIKAVSQRAGHSDERITLNIYTHFLKEEDKKAAQLFDTFLNT